MRKFVQKILIAILIATFSLSPAVSSIQPIKVAKADFFTEFGGELAMTALGCSGILDKATSLLSSLTSSLVGQATGDIPVADNSANSKESCLDAIAYTAAKIVLAKRRCSNNTQNYCIPFKIPGNKNT